MKKKCLLSITSLIMIICILASNIMAEDNYIHDLYASLMDMNYLNGVAVSEVENSFKLDEASAKLIDESQNYFYWLKEEDNWRTYEEEFLTPGNYAFIIVLTVDEASGYEAIHHHAKLHIDGNDYLTFSPAHTEKQQQFSRMIEVKEHTHQYELVEGVEPTCLEPGLHDYYKCDCGLYFEAEGAKTPIKDLDAWKKGLGLLNPLGHELEKIEAVEASKESAGSKAYYHCKRCDLNFEDEKATKEIKDIDVWKVIPKIGDEEVAPTPDGLSPIVYVGIGAALTVVLVLVISKFKK